MIDGSELVTPGWEDTHPADGDDHAHDLDTASVDAPGDHPFHDDPGEAYVVGDPDALPYWHVQEQRNSCAVAAQESVIEEFTGVPHTEAELRDVAARHGWFDPENGTSMNDTGKLLALYGLSTEQHHGASTEQLEAALAEGDGVIVGVDSGEIWNPGFDPDDALSDHLGVPGQGAEHALRVVGVDHSDPNDPQVVLSDSGTPDGQGSRVPLAVFEDAWADSGHFMVTAHRR